MEDNQSLVRVYISVISLFVITSFQRFQDVERDMELHI